MELSRQEYWSGLPFSSPAYLPNPGTELGLLHWGQILYRLNHQRQTLGLHELIKKAWFLPWGSSGPTFFVCFVFLIILLLIYSAVLGLHFCTRAFSSCSLFSRCGAQVSHWNSFSWHEAWAVGLTGFSSCSSSPLKHRLRNCCAGLAALRHVGP